MPRDLMGHIRKTQIYAATTNISALPIGLPCICARWPLSWQPPPAAAAWNRFHVIQPHRLYRCSRFAP